MGTILTSAPAGGTVGEPLRPMLRSTRSTTTRGSATPWARAARNEGRPHPALPRVGPQCEARLGALLACRW